MYEARLKMQRDIATSLAEARDEGREQGRKEVLVRHLHFCQSLLRRAETPAEQLLALSLEELGQLVQQLEAAIRSQSPPSSGRRVDD